MAPVPIYVKGGVWSNIEDQILKAAVQKYGTHQWSKVASLLQKKSAKQCKSRWDEFLNPKLNLNEFTRDEDARLLDLARKLPNQWRTIADAMGRTAQLCIERYNKLLGGGDDDSLGVGSSLEFKVGDIHPNAESLVAKPDAEDLADDEREMLAEARARLLNTQGKKATRKIRERMLEESKRIAQLQRRRELKQAGIDTAIKKSRKKYSTEIDYNEDIVYEQQPPSSSNIYDTSEEDLKAVQSLQEFEKSFKRKNKPLPKVKDAERGKKRGRNDRSNDTDGNTVVVDNSILLNDFKKPKLALPQPGQKIVYQEEIVQNNKQKLLTSHNIGTVLKTEDRISVPTEMTIPVLQKKRSILHLFALLPEPKNDYEIALDSEEELEPVESNAEENKPEKRVSSVLSFWKAPAVPEGIELPKNKFEETFTELVNMKRTEFLVEPSMEEYLLKVEQLIPQQKSEPESPPSWEFPSRTSILQEIQALRAEINQSQGALQYVAPLEQLNDQLSTKTCSDILPRLKYLQKLYFVDYKIYSAENVETSRRKQAWQNLLAHSTKSARQLNR